MFWSVGRHIIVVFVVDIVLTLLLIHDFVHDDSSDHAESCRFSYILGISTIELALMWLAGTLGHYLAYRRLSWAGVFGVSGVPGVSGVALVRVPVVH